jgi:S1-C subfamily serine protease
MYADAFEKISRSTFPLFFARKEGDVSFTGITGTGFFLDVGGRFITAEHTIANAPPGSTIYYSGTLPDRICEPAEVECVAVDPARDLYLGQVNTAYAAPVELATIPVRPGDSVCLVGYPTFVPWRPEVGLAGNVRRFWQPTSVVEAAAVWIGRRKYEGYIVQDTCFPGMSGGPVFDTAGRVRGMAGAVLTRTIPDPEGSPALVQNGIVLDVEQVRTFIQSVSRSSSEVPSARVR